MRPWPLHVEGCLWRSRALSVKERPTELRGRDSQLLNSGASRCVDRVSRWTSRRLKRTSMTSGPRWRRLPGSETPPARRCEVPAGRLASSTPRPGRLALRHLATATIDGWTCTVTATRLPATLERAPSQLQPRRRSFAPLTLRPSLPNPTPLLRSRAATRRRSTSSRAPSKRLSRRWTGRRRAPAGPPSRKDASPRRCRKHAFSLRPRSRQA